MHTYLLSDDTIRRYALDLIARLEVLDATSVPSVWFTLGVSGDKMADAIAEHAGENSKALPTQFVRLSFDRKTQVVTVRDGTLSEDFWTDLKNRSVLVLDSVIHSGASIRNAIDFVASKAGAVLSYSLVVKKTTECVPNYFGLVIDEHDRVFFQLDEFPNNRLRKKPPFGTLRAVRQEDVHRIPSALNTGVPSIDKVTFADLWFETKAHDATAYVYESPTGIIAILHFTYHPLGRLLIDLIACDESVQGSGIGGVLMRWAETFARSSKCTAIELWAIANRVSWYEGHGYERTSDQPIDIGGGEVYERMRRRILYNIKPIELSDPP